MLRRGFLAGLTILPALPLVVHAAKAELNIGIYPGTGKADILMGDFRAYAMPFAQALGEAMGAKPRLTRFAASRAP